MSCIYFHQPLSHAAHACPQSRLPCFFTVAINRPVVLQSHSNTTLRVIRWNTSSYQEIQPSRSPFSCASLSPYHSLSAGYNPCCRCNGDRSVLSANHSGYLTSDATVCDISQSMRRPPSIKRIKMLSRSHSLSSSLLICPPVCLQRITGQYSHRYCTGLFRTWNRWGQNDLHPGVLRIMPILYLVNCCARQIVGNCV